MTTKRVANAIDSYVSQKAPASLFNAQTTIRLSNGMNSAQRGFVLFTMPFPPGVTIVSAKLRFTQVGAHTGTTTVGLARVGTSWTQGTLTWNRAAQLGVSSGVINVTKGSTAHGTVWEFDVTTLVQGIAGGLPNYGWRLVTNVANQLAFHSTQSSTVAARPYLEITWSDAPDKPDQLQPSGGRATSKSSPFFSFGYNDPSGEDQLSTVQVQIASSLAGFGSPVWDSGAVATSIPALDSAAAGLSALPANTLYWWRVRCTDDTGQTSAWSDPESFVFVPKGTLNALVDGGVDMLSPIPTISWSFTGATQKHYQIIATDRDAPTRVVWDSGKVTSTATSAAVPLGFVKSDDVRLRFHVRVYDTVNRVTGIDDPVFVQAYVDSAVAYDNTVTGPSSIGGSSDPIFPTYNLTWACATDPDWFLIQRRVAGGTVWEYEPQLFDPDDLRTSGQNFAYADNGAGSYVDYQWRVLAMRGGKQSGSSPATSGRVARVSPILMTPDKRHIVAFANHERSRTTGDQQELIPVLSGPPVLFTQFIGGEMGAVEGVIADNFLPGKTGAQMADSFKMLRRNPGIKLKLFIASQSLDVAVFNLEIDEYVDNDGLYWSASFEWVQL